MSGEISSSEQLFFLSLNQIGQKNMNEKIKAPGLEQQTARVKGKWNRQQS